MKIKTMTRTALMLALTFLLTFFVKIPLPANGYVHLGDFMVILCGWLLGPLYGGFAAGVGSAMADIAGGFTIYAPVTFILKALSAAVAGLVLRQNNVKNRVLSGILGGFFVPLGYFVFEMFAFNWATAIADLPATSVKEVINIIIAVILGGKIIKSIKQYMQ